MITDKRSHCCPLVKRELPEWFIHRRPWPLSTDGCGKPCSDWTSLKMVSGPFIMLFKGHTKLNHDKRIE